MGAWVRPQSNSAAVGHGQAWLMGKEKAEARQPGPPAHAVGGWTRPEPTAEFSTASYLSLLIAWSGPAYAAAGTRLTRTAPVVLRA